MAGPLIRLGDKTSHGGTVIEASQHSDIDGAGIARVGDKASCPIHGNTQIASGAIQRRAARAWLANVVSQTGGPVSRSTVEPEVAGEQRLAEIFKHLAGAGDTSVLTMLVAFASNLGDQTVARWSEDRTLFASAYSNGMIPGEGAAGLLISALGQALERTGSSVAVLHPVEEDDRGSTTVDKSRHTDSKLLADLAERVLERAHIKPTELAAVVADTGNCPKRVLEMMGLASAISPQLDTSEDVIRTGAATATCGAVPSLAAMILAKHCACEHQKPVVWASNEDSTWRAVTIVHPKVAQASA